MRYAFGKNWAEFLDRHFDERTVRLSEDVMSKMLRLGDLSGKKFLDIGCGSGIHSFAALRLGASKVVSFDYDEDSVATTRKIWEIAGRPDNWEIFQGSVLDEQLMRGLGTFDIVYSWGVLHHTGDMWKAVKNAAIPLDSAGVFYISLYSSENYVSPPPSYWLQVKQQYNRAGLLAKKKMELSYALRFMIIPAIRSGQNPLSVIRDYGVRGMKFWTDVKDWLGGWPMDFASVHETVSFCRNVLNLDLCNIQTGEGCTEYVFCDPNQNEHWHKIARERKFLTLSPPFEERGGRMFFKQLEELSSFSDSEDAPFRSPLMLYENGLPLGLRHSIHNNIIGYGEGRFSHWGDGLYFSTSDGTNPNNSGNTYEVCLNY